MQQRASKLQETYERFRDYHDETQQISPEWHQLEPFLRVQHPEAGIPYMELFPDLSEYVIESTVHAAMLEHVDAYEFEPERPHRFAQQLTHHVELYMALGGVHTAEHRLEAFSNLASVLAKYVDLMEHPETYGLNQAASEYKQLQRKLNWRKRVFASVLEEYGATANDADYLVSAKALNDELAQDVKIPVTRSYKIHAAFAKFDMADVLRHEDPTTVGHLGLPVDGAELQAQYYETLESLTLETVEAARQPWVNRGEISQAVGTLVEVTVLGYLRDRIEHSGRSNQRMARQGFLHEDHMPTFFLDGRRLHVPNMSFDIAICHRTSKEKIKVEVKKGRSNPEPMTPDIMVIKTRYQKTPDLVLLQRIADFARIKTRYWRGKGPTIKESKTISEICGKIGLNQAFDKHLQRLTS